MSRVPTFYVSMPAVLLMVLGIAVIRDEAYVMGGVMIAVSVVLLVIWHRMWAAKSR